MSFSLNPEAEVVVPLDSSTSAEKEDLISRQVKHRSIDGNGVGQYLEFQVILNCRVVSK